MTPKTKMQGQMLHTFFLPLTARFPCENKARDDDSPNSQFLAHRRIIVLNSVVGFLSRMRFNIPLHSCPLKIYKLFMPSITC